MKTFAILLLAGSSTRFSSDTKKQFFLLNNKPVYQYSLELFEKSKLIDGIVLVANESDIPSLKEETKNYKKIVSIVKGGAYRQESVKNGLDALKDEGRVLIHDSARPLIDEEIISNLLSALDEYDGATPAIQVIDTIVKVNEDKTIASFEDRNRLYRVQTPQAFKLSIVKEAHKKFAGENATDDTTLLYKLGKKVKIVEGKEKYRKITKLEDIKALEEFIK